MSSSERRTQRGAFVVGASLLLLCTSACSASPPKAKPIDVPKVAPSAQAEPEEEAPPNMVYMRGGTFELAKYGEVATVKPFWIDTTEVTAADFLLCLRARKCPNGDLMCDVYMTLGIMEKSKHPIVCVDFYEAKAYCEFVGKRLPTSAEWEWAARGGSLGNSYPWGNTTNQNELCWNRMNYTDAVGKGTCPVGSFPAGNTPFGVKDMEGNVSEWTDTPNSPGSNEMSIRGTDWAEINPEMFRIEHSLGGATTSFRSSMIGFRCALSAADDDTQ